MVLIQDGGEPWLASIPQILSIVLDTPEPVSIRHLCALLYPSLSWQQAQTRVARRVRRRCEELSRRGILAPSFSLMARHGGQ